jgi:hypothetical protein
VESEDNERTNERANERTSERESHRSISSDMSRRTAQPKVTSITVTSPCNRNTTVIDMRQSVSPGTRHHRQVEQRFLRLVFFYRINQKTLVVCFRAVERSVPRLLQFVRMCRTRAKTDCDVSLESHRSAHVRASTAMRLADELANGSCVG